jgi:hypothetical protein
MARRWGTIALEKCKALISLLRPKTPADKAKSLDIGAPREMTGGMHDYSISLFRPEEEFIDAGQDRKAALVHPLLPSTRDLHDIVVEELSKVEGRVVDCFDDGLSLRIRSILSLSGEVRPKDVIQGGFAVKVSGESIHICQYTVRQVCKNGAIITHTAHSRRIHRVGFEASSDDIAEVTHELRDAIHACSTIEALSTILDQMRTATLQRARRVSDSLGNLPQVPRRRVKELRNRISSAFAREQDRSVFGLMNAITEVARDEPNGEVRWRLEELGGAVLSGLSSTPKPSGTVALSPVRMHSPAGEGRREILQRQVACGVDRRERTCQSHLQD